MTVEGLADGRACRFESESPAALSRRLLNRSPYCPPPAALPARCLAGRRGIANTHTSYFTETVAVPGLALPPTTSTTGTLLPALTELGTVTLI